jgi:polyisoprenoid-binding protein YceI
MDTSLLRVRLAPRAAGPIMALGGLLAARAVPAQAPAGAPDRPAASTGAAGKAASSPSTRSAGGLRVDTEKSRVYIRVGAEGYGHVHGVEGYLAPSRLGLDGSGELVFAMRRFVADTPGGLRAFGMTKKVSASDQKKVTANMLGADVLDVARYSRAVFALASSTPLDGQAAGTPGRYTLEGEFTLHGVTRRVPLTVILEETGSPGTLRMRGAFAIRQSLFGITPYSALGGLVRVADELEIRGDLVLTDRAP